MTEVLKKVWTHPLVSVKIFLRIYFISFSDTLHLSWSGWGLHHMLGMESCDQILHFTIILLNCIVSSDRMFDDQCLVWSSVWPPVHRSPLLVSAHCKDGSLAQQRSLAHHVSTPVIWVSQSSAVAREICQLPFHTSLTRYWQKWIILTQSEAVVLMS